VQCIGEVMGKHEVAKGGYSIEGVAEGTQSLFAVTVRAVRGACSVARSPCAAGAVQRAPDSSCSPLLPRVADCATARAPSSSFVPATQITGPAMEKEFSQTDAASGKFAFTASDAGAHKVCFANNGAVRKRGARDDSRRTWGG
jgi:hypothetical protein